MNIISNFNNLIKKISKSNSIKARVAKGGIWVGLGNISEKIFRLLRNMILTRILAPEIFGITAIIFSVNTIFESFTEVGIKQSVIQNQSGNEDTFLNGAWWFSFGRSVSLYIIAFILSPFIAEFYGNPELALLMRISFIAVIFNGLVSPKAFIGLKRLHFKKWTLTINGGGVCGILICIILAFFIRNVWAIIIGFVSEFAIRTIISYIIFPFIPKLTFNKDHIKSLMKYARGMIGIPFLVLLYMQIDIFVLGKLVSVKELGFYSMAATLARTPLQFFSSMIDQILMPIFVQIQDNKEKINKIMSQSISLIIFIIFPMMIFVIFYSNEILSIVYGNEYSYTAIPFAIIFASEFIRITASPISSVYLATGKPQNLRLFNIIRAVSLILIIYPLANIFGLNGGAASVVISMIIGLIYFLYSIHKVFEYNIKEYWTNLLKVSSVSIIIALSGIISYLFVTSILLKIILAISALIITYSIIIFLFKSIREIIFSSKN